MKWNWCSRCGFVPPIKNQALCYVCKHKNDEKWSIAKAFYFGLRVIKWNEPSDKFNALMSKYVAECSSKTQALLKKIDQDIADRVKVRELKQKEK